MGADSHSSVQVMIDRALVNRGFEREEPFKITCKMTEMTFKMSI